MIKVINKGYTLTVSSWENDGDFINSRSKTFDTIEETKVWFEMMELCESENNQPKGVIKLGNTYDSFSGEQEEVILNFFKENHKVLLQDGYNKENAVDSFCSLSGDLLGYSETYKCRVMESCLITYSPKDIFLEEIIF